jgi:hypothetical protein
VIRTGVPARARSAVAVAAVLAAVAACGAPDERTNQATPTLASRAPAGLVLLIVAVVVLAFVVGSVRLSRRRRRRRRG